MRGILWAGTDSVLGQNYVVRVNLRLICGEDETASYIMGAAWRKAPNLEEADSKFRPPFNYPSVFKRM